ncbi:MAG TPA: macro domain-containing protein [Roseiarcus sp.]|nr:macro domain-containing protein [Roseiarcus sp.]
MQTQRTYPVGKSTFSLQFGDITTSDCDVVVSSDDSDLSMGGGVSEAVRRAAGEQICVDISKMVPARLGDVIVTGAGAMRAKYIFHAVTIGEGALSHDKIVANVTRRSLRLVRELGLSSIAFPAIGAGVAGFTLETVAATMAEAIVSELLGFDAPLAVTIYLFDRLGRMEEIDYIQFFEEVAVRARGLSAPTKPVVTLATMANDSKREADRGQSRSVTARKIFLASSSELKEDRREFEIFISRKNSDWIDRGVFLRLVVWEDFLDALARTRLQDEYNKEICTCDIFVMLFWTKVGKFTGEEFETALGHFKNTNRPFIFTYFKNEAIRIGDVSQDDLASLWGFQKKLNDLGHFQTVYKSIDDLKYQFSRQLDKLSENNFERLNLA